LDFDCVVEADASIRALDLIGGIAAQSAKVTYVIFEVRSDDMHHHVCLNTQFEQQRPHAVIVYVEHTSQTGEQSFAEILGSIISDKVTHVKVQSLLNKLAPALAVRKLQ
jgi:hypothetical protein